MKASNVDEARSYSMFELVHAIERVHRSGPRVGHTGPPSGEHVRLRPEASFWFESAQVSALDPLEEEPPRYLLTATGFGLYGTSSPLPLFYTQKVLPEQSGVPAAEQPKNAVRDFLDIINHRLLSLRYRAWLKYRLDSSYDARSDQSPLPEYLFALLGLESEALRNHVNVSATRLMSVSGLFYRTPHSADSLSRVLETFFVVHVEIQQCLGHWAEVKPEQQPGLGSSLCRLGTTSVIGARVYLRDRFRVVLGPMSFDRFIQFLPGRPQARQLEEITSLFAPDGLEHDVKLLLDASETRACRLTSEEDVDNPMKLGWTTWLTADEAVLQCAGLVSLVLPVRTEGLPLRTEGRPS